MFKPSLVFASTVGAYVLHLKLKSYLQIEDLAKKSDQSLRL